jgi:hypothetical protein
MEKNEMKLHQVELTDGFSYLYDTSDGYPATLCSPQLNTEVNLILHSPTLSVGEFKHQIVKNRCSFIKNSTSI